MLPMFWIASPCSSAFIGGCIHDMHLYIGRLMAERKIQVVGVAVHFHSALHWHRSSAAACSSTLVQECEFCRSRFAWCIMCWLQISYTVGTNNE